VRFRIARITLLVALVSAALVAAVIAAAPAPAHAACKGKDAAPESISTQRAEQAVFCLLNQKRANRDLPRLRRHDQLDGPARDHSRYMVAHRCFDHECPGEPDLAERLRAYLSRDGRAWGENIAWGGGQLGSARAVVRSWMRSEGHRHNILSRQYEHVGIGVVWGSPQGGEYPAATYTTDFGSRGD
jgi:uncharacterized protein YkwD